MIVRARPASVLWLVAVAIGLACAGWSTAKAQRAAVSAFDPRVSSTDLGRWASELVASDQAERERAFEALSTLDEDALPAIAQRLEWLRARRPAADAVISALTALREIQGSNRADDPVDMAAGVLPVTRETRTAAIAAVAEPVLLLRSLEAIGTPEAMALVPRVFALDGSAWRWESVRVVERLGRKLYPTLLRLQTHEDPWLRRFAKWSLEKLAVRRPGDAVQVDDVRFLADTLRAYGDVLAFDAMPVVVSFVGDERRVVRDASRASLRRFGRNAIWQVREAYLNATGIELDRSTSWERSLHALCEVHDAPRRERTERALTEARNHIAQGKLDLAERALARSLLETPADESAERAAPEYVRLADARFARAEHDAAIVALARAVRLGPSHPDRARWQGQLAFVQAERALAQGVADVAAYERAVALNPENELAASTLAELGGQTPTRTFAERVAVAVAALLLACGGLLLMGKKPSLAA